MDNEIFLSPRN